jgi:hypothetical protein
MKGLIEVDSEGIRHFLLLHLDIGRNNQYLITSSNFSSTHFLPHCRGYFKTTTAASE